MTALGNLLHSKFFSVLKSISGLNLSDFKSLIKTLSCCVAYRKCENGWDMDGRAPADLYCFLVSSCSTSESTCFILCHMFGFSAFP